MSGIVMSDAVITFVKGCMSRERERLARIIERETDPQKIAEAIRDSSQDEQVFEWVGAGKKLP